MHSKIMLSALIAVGSLASLNAFAAGADNAEEPQRPFVSSYSRAEVRADALAVKPGPVTASHEVDGGTIIAAARSASDRSRDEVRAEAAIEARARLQSLASTAPGRA